MSHVHHCLGGFASSPMSDHTFCVSAVWFTQFSMLQQLFGCDMQHPLLIFHAYVVPPRPTSLYLMVISEGFQRAMDSSCCFFSPQELLHILLNASFLSPNCTLSHVSFHLIPIYFSDVDFIIFTLQVRGHGLNDLKKTE